MFDGGAFLLLIAASDHRHLTSRVVTSFNQLLTFPKRPCNRHRYNAHCCKPGAEGDGSAQQEYAEWESFALKASLSAMVGEHRLADVSNFRLLEP
jgi:hypothetical protein